MRIAILGAGVGGLSAAIALKKKGFDIAIYERYSGLSDIGAGIICWPNATFILQELDLLNDIRKVSGTPSKMCRLTNDGEDLGALNIQKLNKKMGHKSYSILRKDLMKILSEHANRLGVVVNYNNIIEHISSSSDNVAEVHLENGESIKADLIIGADGRMNSIARKYVNGNNAPIYQGFINWIGVFHGSKNLFSEMKINDYWGIGKRFGIVPISSNSAYWAAAVSAPASSHNNKNSVEKHKDHKHDLSLMFRNWPEPIAKIIDETPSNTIGKIYVHDHNPMKCWHKNNVLVIGDAAHAPLPTSGQGACQAMEDAWHLAKLMAKDFVNIESVCEEFTKIRATKTEDIITGARQFAASLFNPDPEACEQRNSKSKATDYDKVIGGMSKGWASGLPINP